MSDKENECEKVEEALRESEESYRRLADNSPDMIYRMSLPEGKYEYVNLASTHIFGYPPQTWYDNPLLIRETLHPDYLSYFEKQWKNLLKGDLPPSYEYKIIHKDGSVRWINQRNILVKNEDNSPLAIEGILTDITERKQAEEHLQKSEERFRDLFDNAPVGYFEYDLQGNITRVNRTELKMLGYTAEEMIGQPCWEFIVDEVAREQIMAKLSGVRPRAVGLECTYRRKDGTTFPVLFEDRLLLDEYGHIKGIRTAIQDITHRKRMEEALRESEEKYRILFEHSGEALFVAQDSKIVFQNPRTIELTGYSTEEFQSKPFLNFIHENDREMVMDYHIRRLKGEKLPERYAFRIIHKNGSLLWAELNAVIIQWNGKPAVLCFMTDISERRQAEESLREKTKFLHNIIDTTSDLVSVTDMEGNFKFIGPSHRFLGYDPDSLVGRNVMELVHPDDYQEIATAFAEFLAKKEDGRKVEYRCCRADGGYLWFETVGKFIFDNAGNPKEILFSSRDFTARKRDEEALKENEQKFRTIFNSNMDSISLLGIGPDGKPSGFIDCNNAACDVFGYSKEELMLKKLEELEIQVPESVLIQRLETLQTKGYVNFETIIQDKNGNDRYVEVKAVLMNLAKQPVIMNILRDITERKQAEAKIFYLQKSESLGRMAGAIAHHFNNQLSVVMGNLELVLDDLPDDAKIRKNLSQAFEAGHKVADKSRQMLRYLGHISGIQTTINLSDVCRQSLVFLQSALPSGVTLNVDFPDSGPFVYADAGQIQQILTNLFTNAQESVLENQGIIGLIIQTVSHEDISTSNRFPLDWQPQDFPYACLEISDTGCGISNEDIIKIFDPFYTTKFTGRGMGLSVTIGILKIYGGCITVDNEPSGGCIFRVYLPVSKEKNVKHEK